MIFNALSTLRICVSAILIKKKITHYIFTHLHMEQQHFPVNTLYILLNKTTLSVLQKLLFCDPCIQFKENRIKKKRLPAVQGLRLHVSRAEGVSSIPDWGTRTPQTLQCSQKKKKKGKREGKKKNELTVQCQSWRAAINPEFPTMEALESLSPLCQGWLVS